MRRPLALALAALVGAVLTVVAAAPASAVNVRYQAEKRCSSRSSGKVFGAHILTYGKPTPANPGVMTEVQIWGYIYQEGVGAPLVEATKVVWQDGTWQWAGPVGYENNPVADGEWHRGSRLGRPQIGYLTPTMPLAVQVRGYFGAFDFCTVVLRPYDLEWIG